MKLNNNNNKNHWHSCQFKTQSVRFENVKDKEEKHLVDMLHANCIDFDNFIWWRFKFCPTYMCLEALKLISFYLHSKEYMFHIENHSKPANIHFATAQQIKSTFSVFHSMFVSFCFVPKVEILLDKRKKI